MLLGQRSRSQSALKLCAQASVKLVCVRPISMSCMVGLINYLAKIIIMTSGCVANKNIMLGQRSRSQFPLKFWA